MTKEEAIKKQLDFLSETINYYTKDVTRRSVNHNETGRYNICYYRHPDGIRKCAIGRHISDKNYNKNMEQLIPTTPGSTVYNAIKPSKRLGKKFLRGVQIIHDTNSYWNEKGLTAEGIKKLNEFNERVNSGFYLDIKDNGKAVDYA